MKKRIATFLIVIGLLTAVLSWPTDRTTARPAPLNPDPEGYGKLLSAVLDEVAPAGQCQDLPKTDCNVLFGICARLSDQIEALCLATGHPKQRCEDDAQQIYQECMESGNCQ